MQTHAQAIGQNPLGEFPRGELPVAGRQQHIGNAIRERELSDFAARPEVVRAVANHEFDLIVRGQMRDIAVVVALGLAGGGCFEVQHFHHPGVHRRNGQGATGLQGDRIPGIAEANEQRQAVGLGQRFTAGHGDIGRAVAGHVVTELGQGVHAPTVKGVLRIAIRAAQGTAGQAHENRGPAYRIGLALQRMKNLGDTQRGIAGHGRRWRAGTEHGRITGKRRRTQRFWSMKSPASRAAELSG